MNMQAPGPLLKVGELAVHAGLTVRTLHHYDSIGLLRPSSRSDAGYRLYNRADVARLHAIQTLRRMSLPLSEISELLAGETCSLPAVIARQLKVLEQEIARATELHERLSTMQVVMAGGGEPGLDDWLASLSLMGTYEQYFTTDELKRIFERWPVTQADWPPLLQSVRDAMARGIPPDSIELQPLAQRWMDLAARWMSGEIDLLRRWGRMLREHPALSSRSGADRELLEYIHQAVQLRLSTLEKYLTAEEINRIDKTLEQEWRAIDAAAEELMRIEVPPHTPPAQVLARQWNELFDRLVRNDAALRAKLVAAYAKEPLLQAGAIMGPKVRRYLLQATETLDPHAT